MSTTPHKPPSLSLATFAGWSAVIAASLAMAATLPGRTHALGLITTRLLGDFPALSDTDYGRISFWATLLGSLFCFPAGWLLDRYGPRRVGWLVAAVLGGLVLGMSAVRDVASLSILLTLIRGVGQSMLSVVSLAIIGKAFPGKPGAVMGAYAFVMTILMAVATGGLMEGVTSAGWRGAWNALGLGVLAAAPVLFLLTPRMSGAAVVEYDLTAEQNSADVRRALATPCFWVFGLSMALFSLVSSGIGIFQQAILAERNLPESVFHTVVLLSLAVGLVANLLGGWLATRMPLQHLLGVAMVLLAGSLATIPRLNSPTEAYLNGVLYAASGGLITVLFFTVWGQAYGARELGRIQGVAQMLTVIGSALGPWILTEFRPANGSYMPVLMGLAGGSLLFGVGAFLTAVPSAARGDWAALRARFQAVENLSGAPVRRDRPKGR